MSDNEYDDYNDDDDDAVIHEKPVDFSKMMLEEDEELEEKIRLEELKQQQQQRSGLSASIDQFTAIDVNVNRPAYDTTNSVSYYELGAMYTLLYAHITEGTPIPCMFNPDQ